MANPVPLLVATGLLLGLVAGLVMHRADFCIAGMFRDLFLFRTPGKLRALVLYLATAMTLFEICRIAGLLPIYPFPLLGPASTAGVVGGVIFGIGMVLAGGCVVGTLYRMGAGSLLSLAAFGGLIVGSTLYAEFHPFWKGLLAATTLFSGKITLPQYLGLSPTPLIAATAIGLGTLLALWFRQGKMSRKLYARGAIQSWHAALILAGVSLLSYLLIGMPLGITTAYAKIGGMVERLLFPDHFSQLTFYAAKPLAYRHPLTGYAFTGGAGPSLDGIAIIQFPIIAGIVLGAALSALHLGEFAAYRNLPLRQYISAAIGGILMGLASRMAPACNVWHLMGGLPILAFSSILFLVGILPGAWLGGRILTRWVIR